jgi:hypothetical protein
MSDPKAAVEALEWVLDHEEINVALGAYRIRDRINELRAQAAASPEPVAWEKLRKVNMPYPGESGMRVIGFVVPDDGEPMALITEKLRKIIGNPPAAAERIALLEGLLLRANRCVRMDGDDDLADEIEAALGEG